MRFDEVSGRLEEGRGSFDASTFLRLSAGFAGEGFAGVWSRFDEDFLDASRLLCLFADSGVGALIGEITGGGARTGDADA